jgi:hypothetical protein
VASPPPLECCCFLTGIGIAPHQRDCKNDKKVVWIKHLGVDVGVPWLGETSLTSQTRSCPGLFCTVAQCAAKPWEQGSSRQQEHAG